MRSETRSAWAKPRWLAVLSVLAGGVLLLAACGGSPSNGNGAVAHLGTTATTKGATKAPSAQVGSTQSGDNPGGGGGSGPSGGLGSQMAMADPGASQSQILAFSHCMQTHGDPSFPDPNGQGVLTGINPDVPGFQATRSHCSRLLPNDGQPTPAQREQAVAQALAFSKCMRAHGLPDFPDPQILDGGAQIRLSIGGRPGSDLDPQNPRFQAAQTACQRYGPFKGGGKLSTNGGPK
jgi:hypothetical protein